MTSSSKPNGERTAPSYTRFIPREELQGFAAWMPNAIDGAPRATPGVTSPAPPGTEPPPDAAALLQAELQAARQAGYQDGYRDGLVALDGFKRSFAAQTTAQVGALLQRFDAELAALEGQIADALARTAVELARQVVRGELATEPRLIVRVAEDAVNAVLLSARHIRLVVHPDDLTLVEQGAAEVIAARGVRLTASPEIERGGCRVESDLGEIDARVETRWAQAAAALGQDVAWQEAPGAR